MILLGAYAARSCPVKTHNAFDATIPSAPWEPDDSLAELFEGGLRYEAEILDLFAAGSPSSTDLRPLRAHSWEVRVAACLAALESGAPVILGGVLPVDPAGHRTGSPDVLVRGTDQPDGRPRYHPVEVKWHKIIERRRGRRPDVEAVLTYSTLERPSPAEAETMAGQTLRLASRESDFVQLAHYHRLLEAAGFADVDDPRAAVIGTDDVLGRPVLAWVDLGEPLVRTFSRSESEGWRLRSLLDRYDHEHGFRVDVARRATLQTGRAADPEPLVRPIVTTECHRCQWWEHCRPQLPDDDVSLRIDKGPLDVREIAALRRHGIATLPDLAGTEVEPLLKWYLPEVTHRSGAEGRLRVAMRRARMLLAGVPIERETRGPIEVPAADLEVDFDIETAADGRVYLWGFWVSEAGRDAYYRQFSAFTDLDDAGEAALARDAVCWLRELVDGPRTVRVFHYSAYEVAALRTLARREHDPTLDWAYGYAVEHFVDLLEIVKTHFFAVGGLGLKVIAKQSGFGWRDDDPGGLNSQRWFIDAARDPDPEVRALARRRVLEYNEDDVRATCRVREWLRAS